jgi:GT2 family glycosyltransferase
MTEHPLISVIVPVYNGAATLGGCLEALYASRDVLFEVIVVDDGSTDATRQIAAHYPCRVLVLPQNMGAARAKNAGAAEATGDVLFFTDADVHVRPDTLVCIAEDFGKPQVVGVVGLLAETCPFANFASQFKNLWMHFTYRRQPRQVGLFFTSAAAIRREVFLKEGGFDSHYAGASITEDIEFGQRLLSAGYPVIMDQRLTVEHYKRYTAREVLHTDLLRARGLAQTWIRNRLSPDRRTHYASVPWYFGAGILALGLATALGLAALWRGVFLIGAAGAVVLALTLNAPFLAALRRWRGITFLFQSAGFLLLDLYASGLGIALGLADFLTGKRY